MNTILIIVGVLAVAVGIVIYLQKTGKIEDKDGDLIPDVIEEKVEEAKQVVKKAKAKVEKAKAIVAEAEAVVNKTVKAKRKPSTKK
jgi:beta-lactam-binding protein with PASTA domain